ncbi:ead/Ea22-like family protein [Klebsiella michiganensis]|uniref:ead/Ea22-like family protein n=1 Tax=Klebsiella michiganensis TaxID=1134687 RepID=UPI003CF27E0F
MTTDITELAQRTDSLMDNALETAKQLRELSASSVAEAIFESIVENENGKEIQFERPISDLAYAAFLQLERLVEALEKAQQERENWHTSFDNERFRADKLKAHIDEMTEEQTASINELSRIIQKEVKAKREAEKRIAELESRTVTVKQGEVLVTVAGFTGCGKSAIAGEIEIAMKAIGIPVTWVNGDAEKRMTGADWLTAIEMYKPTVRIVENTPSTAGIKWEAG